MATIDLNNPHTNRLKFSEFEIENRTDKRVVQTTNVVSSVYSSGQIKRRIKATVITSNITEHSFLKGHILGSDYYNNQFRVFIPDEFTTPPHPIIGAIGTTLSEAYTAGEDTIRLTETLNQFTVGGNFNIQSDTTLYTIASLKPRGRRPEITIYPRLAKAHTANQNVFFVDPSMVCNITNTSFTINSSPSTQHYSSVELVLDEV